MPERIKIVIRLAVVLLIVASFVSANAQAPMSTTNEFALKVDTKEIELISEGLGFLPYNKVAPLFAKLQQQINSQIKSMPTTPQGASPIPQE